jgi:hypothetical protein
VVAPTEELVRGLSRTELAALLDLNVEGLGSAG